MRKRSLIPIGKFYLHNVREDETGFLYLRYYIDGRYAKRSTGIRVHKKDWDPVSQRLYFVSGTDTPEMIRLKNAKLRKEKDDVDRCIVRYSDSLTYILICRFLAGDYGREETNIPGRKEFINFSLTENRRRYDGGEIQYSTYYNGRLAIIAFRSFLQEVYHIDKLSFHQVKPNYFERYKVWRMTVRHNTSLQAINKSLNPLIHAVKKLQYQHEIDYDIAEAIRDSYFSNRQVISQKEERRSINEKYLSKKQVEGLIRFYERSNNTRTRDYIEIFLFSLLMGGMRVSDIVTLEWKHIDFETKTLTKLQIKTRRILRIPIVDEAIEILNRWKKKKVNHRFVFNLLSSRFDLNNPEVLRTAILSKNRTIQQSLRNVGEKMGLTFNLTMHCARHTFGRVGHSG